MHILLLTDRDWTHPQGGGTGTNLYGQVTRWLAWGHRVTVIAGAYEDAEAVERSSPNLTVHRMGTRMTVFPRAAWATMRGLGRDADVVLEVVNGIAFCSPAWWWVRAPTVALIHHVHQDHYVAEMGRSGRLAALVAERAPLRLLYRAVHVLTISQAARDDLVGLGIPGEHIHVAYMGVEIPAFEPADPSETPHLLYLGRLKQYKRIEVVLDVLEGVPGAHLDIAGEGDYREALQAEIAARGLGDRVTLHGHVSEEEKVHLYGRAWINLTASSAEGWCLTVMESATVGTPSAALRVGGLEESIVDEQTGLLADTPEELATRVAALVADDDRRAELGAAAQARARGFTWDHTAQQNLAVIERAAEEGRASLRANLRRSETAKAAGMAVATLGANALGIVFTVIFTRLLGVGDYGALGALISSFTILAVAGTALQVAVAREVALGHLGNPGAVGASIRRWLARLAVAGVALIGASIVLRNELAELLAVPEHAWAAAAILPTGGLWMVLSVLRGALQGLHAYGSVGVSLVLEAFGRLALGLGLVLAGAGVTGAYLGTPLSMFVAAVVL
ncbi:MAG: glycosyltransferase, partial [Solirubrobacteraceae bacterium]